MLIIIGSCVAKSCMCPQAHITSVHVVRHIVVGWLVWMFIIIGSCGAPHKWCSVTHYNTPPGCVSSCFKRKFDEIHSKQNCTEMSFWYVLISKRHFGLECISSIFLFKTKRNIRTLWYSYIFCLITGIFLLLNPTTHCGIAMFSSGVHRAPCMRVEFLLKTDSGYPKDTGVTWFTKVNPGNLHFNTYRSAHQSPPSPVEGDLGRGPSHQSPLTYESRVFIENR